MRVTISQQVTLSLHLGTRESRTICYLCTKQRIKFKSKKSNLAKHFLLLLFYSNCQYCRLISFINYKSKEYNLFYNNEQNKNYQLININ